MAKKAKKEQLSFDDMIAKSAKIPTAASKKAKDPLIAEPPKTVRKSITAFLEAKKAKKMAESDMRFHETPVIEWALKDQDEKAQKGIFRKSFKIAGEGDEFVNFVSSNRWSFKQEDVPEIKEFLGDSADDLIKTNFVVQLRAEVFTDDSMKKELMKLLGDRFTDFFETIVTHTVCDDFDSRIYNVMTDDARKAMTNYLMKKAKPGLN